MLDVDGKSYCDIYVVIYRYIDESISFESYGNDCEVNYKVYIKCKDFQKAKEDMKQRIIAKYPEAAEMISE